MDFAASEPIGPGSTVGNLAVEREIGRGAYGVVYLARDRVLGRAVALKTIERPGVAVAPELVDSFPRRGARRGATQ